jgi:hypothetical protein
VEIIPGDIGQQWLAAVVGLLDRLGSDHLVLQYTPLMYSAGRWRIERELLRCWRALAAERPASLIVHESYFRVWWHPPSLVRGTIQKMLLQGFVKKARHVFTASEQLHGEMTGWALARRPVLLPIGSNIPVVEGDAATWRRTYGIDDHEIVLALFGGGNALKWAAGHVNVLEEVLNEARIQHCWLLLGAISRNWFNLRTRVISPEWLSPADLSTHMQLTDIFLMPHFVGMAAKRGTLMAALEHALPVVGTRGYITESFWSEVAGVTLVNAGDAEGFAAATLALCSDRRRRVELGRYNASYFREHFTWPKIARKFLDAIADN